MKQYIKNLGKVRPTADGEHNSSIEYDVLCIVRSGNASYISRCRVPKNTPITNVQYWQLLCSGGGTVVDTDRIFCPLFFSHLPFIYYPKGFHIFSL